MWDLAIWAGRRKVSERTRGGRDCAHDSPGRAGRKESPVYPGPTRLRGRVVGGGFAKWPLMAVVIEGTGFVSSLSLSPSSSLFLL